MSTTAVVNRTRNLRARAKSLGLRASKRGDIVTIADADARAVFAGALDDAEAWVDERYARRAPGPDPAPAPQEWRPWIAMFVSEQHAARRSKGTIETRVVHLTRFARQHPYSDPMTVTREQLIAHIGEPAWSPRTAHSVRTTLRVFFGMLYDLEHRRDNPARTLPSISLPRAMPRPCPDRTIDVALAATANPTAVLAIRLGAETGMRRVEIARLRPADVIGRPGGFWLHITGKGGHQRAIPISDDLAGQLAAVTTPFVFWNPHTRSHVTPQRLGKLVADALPGQWTAHTLRHRFATTAYAAERDLRAVQELLGHVSPVTTAIYTKVADDAMRSAAAATWVVTA